jgi:hypothetical protein
MMQCTIVRLYEDYPAASRAVLALEVAGVPAEDISLIASNADNWYAGDGSTARTGGDATTGAAAERSGASASAASAGSTAAAAGTDPSATSAAADTAATSGDRGGDGSERAESALLGAAVGGTIGTALGALASLAAVAIPGVGPVVGLGWLAAMAGGALLGAAAGGIIGALTKAGVSAEDAPVYAESIRRGGAVVSARVPESDRAHTEAILDRDAVDINARRAEYQQSGWKDFDAGAPAYTPDQVRAERALHARAA